ncbi:MAG: hypothetical protein AAGU14_08355 [Eubacteriaceae bacterium]
MADTNNLNFDTDVSSLKELSLLLTTIQTNIDNINVGKIEQLKVSISTAPETSAWDKIEIGASIIASLLTISSAIYSTIIVAKKGTEKLVTSISNALKDENLKEQTKEIGTLIGEGLMEGIKGTQVQLNSTIYDATGRIIQTAETTLEVKSPSKVFQRIGSYISEGLGMGIKDGAKTATNAMERLSDNVVDSSKSLSKIGDGAKDYKKSLDDVGDATDKVSKKKISFGGAFAIALTVISALVGFFQNLMATNEEFGAKVDKIWGKITEAFAPVVDAVMGLFDTFTTGGEGMGSVMDGITGIISGAADSCFKIKTGFCC